MANPNSAINVGGACGCYRNTASHATPTWVENQLAKDVVTSGGHNFGEAPSRQSPLIPYGKTTVDKPTQVVMRADRNDPEYQEWVRVANSQIEALDLLILNGKRTKIGACGYRGPHLITLAGEPQNIDGTLFSTFECRPTVDENGEQVQYATVTDDDGDPIIVYVDPSWTDA